MKKVEFSLLLVLLLVAIICCDGKDFPVSNIGLKNFSNTGCKPSTRSSESKQPWGQVFGSSSRHTQVPVPVTILQI